jgi:hypothetical protein
MANVRRDRKGQKRMLFTDDLWETLEQCWSPQPKVRPTVGVVLACLERSSPIVIPSSRVYPPAFLQQTGHRRDNSSEGTDLSKIGDQPSIPGLTPQTPTHPPNWRTKLNNFFMHNGGTARLRYVYNVTGPSHQPTWHCTVHGKPDVPLCDIA